MNWRNPNSELPKPNQLVGVLTKHKTNNSSCAVYFGWCSWRNDLKACCVDSMDEIGHGCVMWELWRSDDCDYQGHEKGIAWIPIEEFNFPTWVEELENK